MAEPGARSLVVFDFDGTLADTWRDIETALNLTLGDVGLPPVGGPEVRAWIGSGALRLLEQAVPEPERTRERLEGLYENFRVHYERCCLDTTDLYPGIRACLDALEGVELAVLSNKPSHFLDRIIEGLGVKGRFGVVIGGDVQKVQKPDPRALGVLIERLGPRPDEVWMVGDSAIDVETGRGAAARTIGCAWGLRGRQELREARVEILVEHPSEIPPLILG